MTIRWRVRGDWWWRRVGRRHGHCVFCYMSVRWRFSYFEGLFILYPLLQGKAKHFQKMASYSSDSVFTSPIVTSSVTRPLDNVFAGTGDEGELVGDMAIVSSVIWACAEGSPISRGSSFCIHCYKEKQNIFKRWLLTRLTLCLLLPLLPHQSQDHWITCSRGLVMKVSW